MSGIYGVASLDGLGIENYENLEKWNAAYGDQKKEVFFAENLYLGIKPQKLKEYENNIKQGVQKHDEKIGVVDGLIYSDVNNEMSDESFLFSTICDNGIDSLSNINGDFAGAIWDGENRNLLLFRDHVGVRPLFYYFDGKRIIFSSDIRGITSISDIDAAIDEKWIYYNVTNVYFPTVIDTEYEKIKCVPPGGYIKFSFLENKINAYSDRFWIPGQRKIKLKDRASYTKELRRLVEDAIKIRANVTKYPIGAELSGGLDSGVIDILLSKMEKNCFYYSWSSSKEERPYVENDERIIIDDICKENAITCHHGSSKISFNKHTQMNENSPLIFTEQNKNMLYSFKYAFPEYVNTLSIYDTAAVMQENGIKLVFTGHGGDEGVSHRSNPYELYYNHEYYRYFRLMFSRSSVYKNRLINTIRLIRENMKEANEVLLNPIPQSEGGYSILNKDFVKELRPEQVRFLFPYNPKEYIRRGGIRNRLDVLAFYGASTGVRYVAPFVDYRLIDFALGIPRYLYLNWYHNRFIFREAFKDIIPKSLYRVKIKQDHSFDADYEKSDDDNQILDDEEQKQLKEMRIRAKKDMLSWLDRDCWGKYLDFNVLDSWANEEGNPEYDESITMALSKCIQADYMVKRSRELKDN